MGFENKIGALWENTSKSGNKYFSGVLELEGKKIKVIAFPNKKRPEKKDPDINIFLSTEDTSREKEDEEIPF